MSSLSFHNKFLCQILIAEAMHISNALAHQLKGFGIIEKVQSLLVCQARLLSKQFDDASVFTLEENRISLHISQCYRLYELKIMIYYSLGGDAELIIRFFPTQLVKSLLSCIDSLKVEVNGVKDVVVGNTAFNYVILLMWKTFAASHHVIKPFAIISRKYLALDSYHLFRKFKDIHDGGLATTNKTLSIVTSLLLKRSEIKANAKIKMLARMANVRLRDNHIGCMEIPHAAFSTPFLFIKSTRSSTMYSRENVCNTSKQGTI